MGPKIPNSIFKYTTMGPKIPKEMKYKLHYDDALTTGLFYNHTQRYMSLHKVNIHFTLNITGIFLQLRNILRHTTSFLSKQIDNILLIAIVMQMSLICGDAEANPGPNSTCFSISIFYLNIRSIRQKLEFIKVNLLDYDIFCFTEGHLNEDISSTYLPSITKTCLYNFDSLTPHFYIAKTGFTGVYITFLISAQKQIVGTR